MVYSPKVHSFLVRAFATFRICAAYPLQQLLDFCVKTIAKDLYPCMVDECGGNLDEDVDDIDVSTPVPKLLTGSAKLPRKHFSCSLDVAVPLREADGMFVPDGWVNACACG